MKRWMKYLLCALLCAGLLAAISGAASARADGLEVHFMNVERNDGILIRCGGEDVFIDAGGYSRGRTAVAYMQNMGVTGLKYYIGTHAHDDHVGGAPIILAAYPPEAVIQPHDGVREVIEDNIRSRKEVDAVQNAEYVNMRVGQQLQVGGATLTCLGPISIRDVRPSSGLENDNSLVLMLTYGEVRILLSGDATSDEYEEILALNPGCLKADVYKNAHHNQITRASIFSVIQPEYVIFSTAKDRMPEKKYMETMHSYGAKIFATSTNHSGNLILRTDGSEISFETQYRTEEITLKENSFKIYEGKDAKLKAYTKPSGRTQLLTYASSDPSVATVSADGRITGIKPGEAVIRVMDAGGAQAECRVTVLAAEISMRKTELSVKHHSSVSASVRVRPSGCDPLLAWTSADRSIAAVDQNGRITGAYPGVTTITATSPAGKSCSVTVTVKPVSVSKVSVKPSSATMTIGEKLTLTASVSPKDATWPEVTWTSADDGIVTVAQDGQLHAVGVGRTTVAATTKEGKSREVKITVKPVYVDKIRLSAQGPSVLIGGVAGRNQVQLGYSVEPADATIQTVVWSTSNKKIATVDENGLVTGHAAGKVTITCKATDGSGEYERMKITFGDNELERTVRAVPGELVCQASRIRYTSNRLEIRMTCVNGTADKQQIPPHGMLALITPEGDQIPLMPVSDKPTTLRKNASKTYTYKIPLASYPRLASLDLTCCDAVILQPGQQ